MHATRVNGELQVLLEATPRAVVYEVGCALGPVGGPWRAAGAYNSTRGIELTS